MKKSRCIIAAAGSGKTSFITRKALEASSDKQVLITTFTRENENEIRNKIIQKCKTIPGNIKIQTWWKFLLQHGVRPYHNTLIDKHIKGLLLVQQASGVKTIYRGRPIYWEQSNVKKYYFSHDYKIYSDKIALFVIKCNEATNGAVFNRLSNIFDYIYIDEIQDFAGYDLEIIHAIIQEIETILVGDPRQVTYHTHYSKKNTKYLNGKIEQFITDRCSKSCEIDNSSLKDSYRCHQLICNYSNTLFPDLPQSDSLSKTNTDHDGVFFISSASVNAYINRFKPIQLRYDRRTKVNENYPVYNFGESKGLTFYRTLIYPTGPIKNYIKGIDQIPSSSLCKYYVALTRAQQSVSIVFDDIFTHKHISPYNF